MAFCETYRREAGQTGDFTAALKDHDLLVEGTLSISYTAAKAPTTVEQASAAEAVVNGFRMVDEAKFRALPANVVTQFHARGWTDLVVLHLASQLSWRALMEASVAGTPVEAARLGDRA